MLNKYNRFIRRIKFGEHTVDVYVDVYDVLKAFHVDCPARAHAIKKILAPGKRGFKSREMDTREAIDSLARALELDAEHEHNEPDNQPEKQKDE